MMPYVHIAIMFIIMFGFRFLPPFLAMTPNGMAVLGAFLGWLYGVCFSNICFACLLGFIAISFTGIMPITQYYTAGFGSDTVILLIFSMIFIGGLVSEFNLTELLMKKMFHVKIIYGRPWIFSGAILLLSYLVCTFTNPYIVTLFIYQIIITISKKVGFKPFSAWPSIMIIACTLLSSLTIINMPYKATTLLFFGIFSGATNGLTVSWGGFMIFVHAIAILGTILYLCLCRILFRPDISALAQVDASLFGETNKATKKQKMALGLMVMFVISLLGFGFVPESWALKSYLNMIGLAGIVMICIMVAMLLRVEGEPLVDFIPMAKKGMQWDVFLILGFSIPLMTLLTNEETGITASLMSVLMPILSGHSPIVFIIVVLIISVLLTNCFNNMVVIMIMTPIVCGYALEIGANPALLITMLIITGYLAILLPAGSPLTAIMFGHREWMNMKVAWIYGGLGLVVLIFLMFGFGLLFGNIIF